MWGVLLKGLTFGISSLLLFAQLPSSTNYKLKSYGVSSGGTANSTSSSYALEGITGEQSGGISSSTNYKANTGMVYTQQANVPVAPTFTNPSSYYNKLHVTINTSNNPTDAKFAIAISTDDFTTTNYVQNDNTVGTTLGVEDYQTYAAWGGASGEDIIGLLPNTTYKVKVKATQGKFTESGYGPIASAATVNPTLSFSINTDSQGSPPFSISFGTLTIGSVSTSTDKINATISTNAQNGGRVYIYDSQAGIFSTIKSYTIASATADLAMADEGYGAVSVAVSQDSGGPISAVSPYNGSSDNVGLLNTSIREIYSMTNPITNGIGSFRLKVKPKSITPAANDYSDTLTLIAAGHF